MIDTVAAAIEAHPNLGRVAFCEILLDRDRRVVSRDGYPDQTLQLHEAKFLAALMKAPCGVLNRTALYEALYWDRGETSEPDPRIVTVYACKVRRKLRSVRAKISCIWGEAYELTVERP